MSRSPRTRAAQRIGLSLGLLAILAGLVPAGPVMAASDRLPDLKVTKIRDVHVARVGGRRVLRFTGMMWNKGTGPLEIRSTRKKVGAAWDVDQIVYDSAGGHRRVETTARLAYAGDGHDHWHVRQMLTYHLWGASGTLRDAKIGFCFFDTNLISGSLKHSPSRRVYTESMCGKHRSLKTRNGISVGWGDKYPWTFAYQWIDITGLPGGTYTLRAAVDLYGRFVESSDANNCAWARVKFKSSGTSVKVLARGTACVNDHAKSAYASDIAWAREVGISNGCDADMFCTNDPMTRGQVASWFVRALHTAPATVDRFTDDTGTAHEADINAIAEAGIATGCTATTYCPTKHATRALVAAMLARALDLPPATQDWFDDDAGSSLESDINRAAEAGIVDGCGERTFCPKGDVSRGLMAALLHRAVLDAAS